MYKMELSIYLVKDGISHNSIDVAVEGDTVCEVKGKGKELIINALAPFGFKRCNCYVDLLITKRGEFYDHDESYMTVDIENNKLLIGAEVL